MSSLPLISHHLFVAAVKSKGRAARRPAHAAGRGARSKSAVIEVPLELLEFGRPEPWENAWPFGAISRTGSS